LRGPFPFEHAGGEGTLACNTVYRLRGFSFYQGYYCPLCSISTLTYLLVFVLHSTWRECVAQSPSWDDEITTDPLRLVDSGSLIANPACPTLGTRWLHLLRTLFPQDEGVQKHKSTTLQRVRVVRPTPRA
jgi:hypothetical protein